MKLRNKKTGEIYELRKAEKITIPLIDEDGDWVEGECSSLAELNEEWTEYEEPKEYWFINDLDGKPMKCELRYCPVRDFTEWIEKRKQIGNYFETKEEAEKAVENHKAWKRLKDKGFRFVCWNSDYTIDFTINGQNTEPFKVDELSRDLCTVFNRVE